jgi:hypothetical protein
VRDTEGCGLPVQRSSIFEVGGVGVELLESR